MRIYFSRYQGQARKYVLGFWATFLIGGIAALAVNPVGFGLGALFLAVSFVALCGYMSATVQDSHADQELRAQELSGDEYMALDSRLQTYPELKDKVAESLGDSDRITYAQAYELEDLVNAHVDEVMAIEDAQARERNRAALLATVGKDKKESGQQVSGNVEA